MWSRLVVIGVIAVAGCKRDPSAVPATGSAAGPDGQTLRAAMEILCGRGDAPPDVSGRAAADRQRVLGDWLDARIINREARALIAALADTTDRAARVRATAVRAGITDCAPLAVFAPTAVAGVTVPDVTAMAAGTEPVDQELPVIAISTSAVTVDGAVVAPIHGGVLAAGAAADVARAITPGVRDAGRPDPGVVIAADPATAIAIVIAMFDAIRLAGGHRAELAVVAGTEIAMVPIEFPRARTGGEPEALPVIAIAAGGSTVITPAGAGGTGGGETPVAHSSPAAVRDGVHAALRASGGGGGELAVRVTGPTTVQVFAEVVAAARALPDRTPLYPRVTIEPAVPDAPRPEVR